MFVFCLVLVNTDYWRRKHTRLGVRFGVRNPRDYDNAWFTNYPWHLTDENDEKYLFEALSVALDVAEKLKTISKRSLGFSAGTSYNRSIPLFEKNVNGYLVSTIELPDKQEKYYPAPIVRDELLLARLQKKKKTRTVWACEVVMLPSPISNEAGDDIEIVKNQEIHRSFRLCY